MPELVKRDGMLVKVDGALSVNPECCCGECPECPPIEEMPHICEITLKPSAIDFLNLVSDEPMTWGVIANGSTAWRKEVIEGICYYKNTFILSQPCCESRCEDDVYRIPIQAGGGDLECTRYYSFECETEESGTVTVNATDNVVLSSGTGNGLDEPCIIPRLSETVSNTLLHLDVEMDCSTGLIRGRITRLEFIYRQDFQARFVAIETWHKYTAVGTPAECAFDTTIITNFNFEAPVFGCGEEGAGCYRPDQDCLGDPVEIPEDSCCFNITVDADPLDPLNSCVIMPYVPNRDSMSGGGAAYCWKTHINLCNPTNYSYGTSVEVSIGDTPSDWFAIVFDDDQEVGFNPPPRFTNEFASSAELSCAEIVDTGYERPTLDFGGSTFETIKYTPPANYEFRCENDETPGSGDNDRSPPWIDECDPFDQPPGLEVTSHVLDDDWHSMSLRFAFVRIPGTPQGTCPTLDAGACQPKIEGCVGTCSYVSEASGGSFVWLLDSPCVGSNCTCDEPTTTPGSAGLTFTMPCLPVEE